MKKIIFCLILAGCGSTLPRPDAHACFKARLDCMDKMMDCDNAIQARSNGEVVNVEAICHVAGDVCNHASLVCGGM